MQGDMDNGFSGATHGDYREADPDMALPRCPSDHQHQHPQGLNGLVRAPPRKLILHFDIRNTILVADAVTNARVEQALNSYLTGVTWGQSTADGWVWHSEQPSLTAPSPDSVTYYKHLEARLVREPSDRALLRRETGDFTQEPIGEKFAPYFREHLKLLEWPHDVTSSEVLTMSGVDGRRYHYILPSFFSLLKHLREHRRDFAIVIRTYGLDAGNALRCIKHTVDGGHPEFPPMSDLKVNLTAGRLHRDKDNFRLESPDAANVLQETERDIYDNLTSSTGVSGYKDDFLYWQQNSYCHKAGKPLWIDLSDRSVHHIFFDDNIRVTDDDSIVDIRVLEPGSTRGRSLSRTEGAMFEDVSLVQADLLKSTEDRDYFINKVDLCERNYEQLLNSGTVIPKKPADKQ